MSAKNGIHYKDIKSGNYDKSVERVICAAIWYKDFPIIKEDIPSDHMRPYNCDEGVIFCGHRHPHCMYSAIAISGKRQVELGREVQGFLTNLNRFVDRKEGARIVIDNKQIDTLDFSNKTLYSEDLY
jgi:hypothetical protein